MQEWVGRLQKRSSFVFPTATHTAFVMLTHHTTSGASTRGCCYIQWDEKPAGVSWLIGCLASKPAS